MQLYPRALIRREDLSRVVILFFEMANEKSDRRPGEVGTTQVIYFSADLDPVCVRVCVCVCVSVCVCA